MENLFEAMEIVAPGTKWISIDNSYEKLTMLDGSNKPTLEELQGCEQQILNNKNNITIYSSIEKLEKELYRPMRELLSTESTEETKLFSQNKIDDIEIKIQDLRSQLK